MATTVRYGITNTITKSFDDDYQVSDLLRDPAILGALSAPEGCSAITDGETLESDEFVNEYATISLEKKAASKAA